ncbi:hypothetical protein [Streptomyces marianii]|uniref:Uncharacterized protein n=1 Tax=Streptomyces marianii TaxID=1817406 RepID=A0A5R9ECG2_9ACTN|nr:hypothetical protein [Streptomyces marianii]TLQ45764.1 hypothetical protein FEF34_24685 [Streptomyces marianii]
MKAARTWAGKATERLAVLAGMTARVLPGVGGAALVSYGLWLAWQPLGFVTAGAFLLLLDRRMP